MKFLLYIFASILLSIKIYAADMYCPPLNSDEWENVSSNELNLDQEKIDGLYQFLEEKNSKAFILLYNGKIVLEKYFDTFTKDSNWYWASAGKSLTASLISIAQNEGYLSIEDRTSEYLGQGWTSMSEEKENLILIKHQLTMTTGLDYEVDNIDCYEPECLKYKADAGTQWFYHNAPYTLLDKVLENATGMNYNVLTTQKIKNKIGMNGLWVKLDYNNVFFSTPRSMARYGILILNNGYWENDNVIQDNEYLMNMINTSQNINKSYGYLWWLNGKESFMIPGLTNEFDGMLMPDAPSDTYAALGKNGQCLNISPSNKLIWVRMGNRPDDQFFISTAFSNSVWQFINEIIEEGTNITENDELHLAPNPANDHIFVNFDKIIPPNKRLNIEIYNSFGEIVRTKEITNQLMNIKIDISDLPTGIYLLKQGEKIEKFIKY